MRGTYIRVVALERPTTLEVGALGSIGFDTGAYAYVGSAFGSSDCECAGNLLDAPSDRDVLEASLEAGGCLEPPLSDSGEL